MTLSVNWDLDALFAGGSQSADLAHFLDALEADFAAFEARGPLPSLEAKTEADWVDAFQTAYALGARLTEASAFIACLLSQDVGDEKARQLMGRVDALSGRLGTLWTRLAATAAAQPDDAWAQLLAETELLGVAFHLDEQREIAREKMSPEKEALANELATNGYHAWDRLYEMVSGDKQVEFEGEPLSLGQLQSKFMDAPERDVRRRAFDLFENSWEELAKTCALALNYQAGFRLTLYEHRGWESVLKEPLMNNRLTRETLEAMWAVIDAGSSKLLDYFEAKARLLGVEKLSWYDTWAPVGKVTKTFSYAEAADFVVESIRKINPDIADYCRMAIDREWIEAEDRPYKRAGAFSARFPVSKETRVFMTYNGSYNGLLTLAHELGHGYHGWNLFDLPHGAQRYAMSVAETASTMNELIVKDAGIRAAGSDAERLRLLGTKLNDAANFLMNIRARYDFERAFFDARAGKQLGVDELSALMVDAQKGAYKEGLDRYHPLFWASKLHFYLTRAPFYNFPYTFGYLFSHGVYAQALEEGAGFRARYVALLRDTGSMQTEALARKHLGVDLTQPDFWETAVGRVLADVDHFVALAEKAGAQPAA